MQSINFNKIILYVIVLLVTQILSSILIDFIGSENDGINSALIEYIGFGLVNIIIFSFLAHQSRVERLYLHAFLIYLLFSTTTLLLYLAIFKRIDVPQKNLFLDIAISLLTIILGLKIGVTYRTKKNGAH